MNDMTHMHNMQSMQYRLPMPAQPGIALSEFNHHLAGIVILALGISVILIHYRPRKFEVLKYVWPLSMLLLGLYLIVYSDPEAWPSGYKSLTESLHDPVTQQHKTYAVLLVVLGIVEFGRTVGWLKAKYWSYVFPILAGFGALYLIAHEFAQSEMHMHEGSMGLINMQHTIYIIIGVGIAVSMLMQNTGKLRIPGAGYIWPALTALLGLALMFYRE